MRVANPQVLRRGSDREAIREDIRPYLGTTVEERVHIAQELCAFAAEQIAARADGDRVLAHRDPVSPASRALWRKLVALHRGQHGSEP